MRSMTALPFQPARSAPSIDGILSHLESTVHERLRHDVRRLHAAMNASPAMPNEVKSLAGLVGSSLVAHVDFEQRKIFPYARGLERAREGLAPFPPSRSGGIEALVNASRTGWGHARELLAQLSAHPEARGAIVEIARSIEETIERAERIEEDLLFSAVRGLAPKSVPPTRV